MQTEAGLKSTLIQQVSKALLQSKIVDRNIDHIREVQFLSLFNIFLKQIEHEWMFVFIFEAF